VILRVPAGSTLLDAVAAAGTRRDHCRHGAARS
jgi:hypothetical protein